MAFDKTSCDHSPKSASPAAAHDPHADLFFRHTIALDLSTRKPLTLSERIAETSQASIGQGYQVRGYAANAASDRGHYSLRPVPRQAPKLSWLPYTHVPFARWLCALLRDV